MSLALCHSYLQQCCCRRKTVSCHASTTSEDLPNAHERQHLFIQSLFIQRLFIQRLFIQRLLLLKDCFHRTLKDRCSCLYSSLGVAQPCNHTSSSLSLPVACMKPLLVSEVGALRAHLHPPPPHRHLPIQPLLLSELGLPGAAASALVDKLLVLLLRSGVY